MYIVSSLFKYKKFPYDDERGCSVGTLHFLCRNSGRPSQNLGNFGHSNSINSERGKKILGHARYYRRLINFFSKLTSPLFFLLTKDVDFCWNDNCELSFADLEHKLSTTPILRGPNWALPFQISSDASDTAIGAVLGKQEDKEPYAIYYINKNMAPAELNYIVIEREFLAIVYAINKFRHYVTGYPTFIHTDHTTIKYLMNKPITNV
jgi:hypothetical protein